jgi:hypothetical protein
MGGAERVVKSSGEVIWGCHWAMYRGSDAWARVVMMSHVAGRESIWICVDEVMVGVEGVGEGDSGDAHESMKKG